MSESMSINWLTIALILTLFAAIYLYFTRSFSYWKSRGINGPKPIIFFGNIYQIFFAPFSETLLTDYRKYGPIYGRYMGSKPILVIGEPKLVKDIFVKDFHIFVDRNNFNTGDPISDESLFNAKGDHWKQLRSVISPTFSSSKMRKMQPLIEDCVKSLENVLTKAAINKQEVELKKLMGNLTMDVIATCAFATKLDTHSNPNNQFVKNAETIFRGNWKLWIRMIFLFTFPSLAKQLKLSVFDKNTLDFFKISIGSIIEKRKTDNSKHVDFLQLMLNAEKTSEITEENDAKHEDNKNDSIYTSSVGDNNPINKTKYKISETDILATAFLFIVAGYETTAALLSFLCYSLAMHEHCQQTLYDEIKCAQNLEFETISKLPYLDACIAETQRLYTSVAIISRMASEDYKLGDTGITISKGTVVQTNFEGIHHNPQYYPNPDRFDPERFMPENRDKLVPYTFLPFGIGPRNCVGMRFALMEAKTAIAHIITKFKFVRTDNTEVPLQYKKFAIFLMPKNDIKVGVELRS